VLLIALAMSAAWLQGQHTSTLGKSSYICRQKETTELVEDIATFG
jgi:hypothetical protein